MKNMSHYGDKPPKWVLATVKPLNAVLLHNINKHIIFVL